MATETAEAAGGKTGSGGTLNSPLMTTVGFSLNDADLKRIEDRFPEVLDPAENFRLPLGGLPAALGGVGGLAAATSGADVDIFHFRGSVDEMYGKCMLPEKTVARRKKKTRTKN
jgi:hypothetical protein